MRTTVTIDGELLLLLRAVSKKKNQSLRKTLNDILRSQLIPKTSAPVDMPVWNLGIKAGIDINRLNSLNDELQAEEAKEKL